MRLPVVPAVRCARACDDPPRGRGRRRRGAFWWWMITRTRPSRCRDLLELSRDTKRNGSRRPRAVEAAARFRPEVILLDIGLPGLNGYEAARRIREQPWGKEHGARRPDGLGPGRRIVGRSKARPDSTSHLVKPVDFDALAKLLASLPLEPPNSLRRE